MRILISGGGTAGHVNPALAIAQIIKEKCPQAEILFVCSKEESDRAAELVPLAGYPFERIRIKGAARPLYSPKNIYVAMLMVSAKRQAAALIREFSPDLIIGTGGFVCWPVVKAGAKKGIPTLLHESNAAPGLAVRMLREDVDRILVNFPETVDRLCASDASQKQTDKIVCVGNPVMRDFTDGDAEAAFAADEGKKGKGQTVLAFGGSGGAAVFNRMVLNMLRDLAKKRREVRFVFATGPRYYEETAALASEMGIANCLNVEICPYLYDMPERMRQADLILCRAGAMTLSEVAQMGKAAIIIPSPNVTDNHQYKNAKAIADADAGILVTEDGTSPKRLTEIVSELLDHAEIRDRLGKHIKERFARTDVDQRIWEELVRLCPKLEEEAKTR